MPIYEYDCPSCGRFEILQKIDEKPLRVCPVCTSKGRTSRVTKLVSPVAFHLKGTGWYKTDYASSGSDSSRHTNGKASHEKGIQEQGKIEKAVEDSKSSEKVSGSKNAAASGGDAPSGESDKATTKH